MAAVDGVESATTAGLRSLGRAFAMQLASTGLANLGDGILGTIAPLVALGLTASPLQISLIAAATWLPWLVLGVAAGVIVDRVDRRGVQIAALLGRAALLAALAIATALGWLSVPLLAGVVLLYGVTEVFADLGATAIVPQLVASSRLAAANGRVVGVQQVANSFLGAPIGGLMLVAGASAGFGMSAGLAALAGVALLFGMRGDFRPRAAASERRGGWHDVGEGLVFLFGHAVLRPLVIAASVLNLASTAYFAVFVLWAVGPTSAIGLTAQQYPFLLLGFAAGAVVGSLLAERVQRRWAELPTILTGLVASSVLLLVPVLWPDPWVTAATLAVVGVANTVGNVVSQSMRQRLVPTVLQGRVSGASRALGFGLMPVGALAGGAIAETRGLPVTFVAAVAVMMAACGYLAFALRGVRSVEPGTG